LSQAPSDHRCEILSHAFCGETTDSGTNRQRWNDRGSKQPEHTPGHATDSEAFSATHVIGFGYVQLAGCIGAKHRCVLDLAD